jgi:hypothetical protein
MERIVIACTVLVTLALAGCSAGSSPAATPGAVTRSAAPVSQSVTVSGKCTPGLYDTVTGQYTSLVGLRHHGLPAGDTFEGAYQVTLTDTSSFRTAQVNALAVIFYNSSGQETGSDQKTASGLIAPHQSMSWQETLSTNPFAVGVSGAVDTGATCQFVQR